MTGGILAHGSGPTHLLEGFAQFGTDWLYVLVPLGIVVAGTAALLLAGRSPDVSGPRAALTRLGDGLERVTGLPAWSAAPLLLLVGGALPLAVLGFFWDVAWHIDIGRDEFLFSPPHAALALAVLLLGVAGVASILFATRSQAPVRWRVGRMRVPYGAVGLVVAGGAGTTAFFVDELWHWAYGLDVSMWGPTHLTMISAFVLSPLFAWALLAEAGPGTGARWLRGLLLPLLSVVMLEAATAWQLEFDLGVPQWQHLYQPVLIALAGGFALVAARAILGRGGALVATAGFLVLRLALFGITAGLWNLSEPRFPLYLAAAVAVEAAFLLERRLTPVRLSALAGLAVGTVGLAGEWAWSQVWFWHPWTTGLLPAALVATAIAVPAAVLGGGFGRVIAHRPSGVRPAHVASSLFAVAVLLVVPLPRNVPDGTVTVATTPVREGWVRVAVEVDPPAAVGDADRWEVMSWQGQGHRNAPLIEVGPGRFVADGPVPVHADWKSIVRLARGDLLGTVPVYLPADPAIDAAEVPVAAVRTQPFQREQRMLMRETHAGPAWPGVVAYTFVAGSIGTLIVLAVAGAVGLERRRRARGWTRAPSPLRGARVLLTGSVGAIGRATRAALEAQGARVVGIDRAPGGPEDLLADITDPAAVRAAVSEADRRLGGIDILVNNAGIGHASDAGAPPDEGARRAVEVNLWGAWQATAAALPSLLANRGQVIHVGSGLAVATVPYAAAYQAGKRAATAHADTLRLEYAGRLSVSVVHPGYIPTPIHDPPAARGASLDGVVRRESVEDAVAAIVTACETRTRQIASSPLQGLELAAARHLPRVVDRVVLRRIRRVERTRPRPEFVLRPDGERPAADRPPAGTRGSSPSG